MYSVAKGVFSPWLRWGLRWTIEGAHNIPTSGPVVPREQSRLVSRSVDARVGGRSAGPARALPRQGRALRQAGARPAVARRAPDPRAPGPSRRGRRAQMAVDALERGECVGVFPEGTISEDLEPMVAKSGTARLARRAGVAITPVGLWGTHRILTKGRKPHWQWGVAQTAVVGEPIVPGPDEHVKQTTDRMMAAIVECVARARELYPPRGPGEVPWWWRDPDTADAHRRTWRDAVAVVGAGSWGTAVAAIVSQQRFDGAVGPARRAGRASTPITRIPTTWPASVFRRAARHRRSRRRVRRCRRRGVRGAVARLARGAGRRPAAHRAERGDREPRQGHRAGNAAPDDRGDRRGARRSRSRSHRRAHRPEPRARGRGRPADLPRSSPSPTPRSPTSCSACSSRRRCASTRTPTWSVARWPAR